MEMVRSQVRRFWMKATAGSALKVSCVCWARQPQVLLVTITNKKHGFLAVAMGEELGVFKEY